MRESKFRFWDKHNKVWVGPYTLKQLADEDAFSYDREVKAICSKWEWFESVEYIGRKDCKGEEVYEGDILGVDDPEDNSRVVVEFHDSGFAVRPVGGMIYAREWSDWIVIGNIYDNPELGAA